MDLKDKLITLAGVLVLIFASVGVYYYDFKEGSSISLVLEDFIDVCGVFSKVPNVAVVSSCNPFFALIATPLTVHYDDEGVQEVIPFFVKDFEDPSRAVDRAVEMIGVNPDLVVQSGRSAKDVSLELIEQYWESSEAVLIIEDNQSGYNLGVLAAPLASYLSIPVVVVDELDSDVKDVLSRLGVVKSIVCGDVEGFGGVLRFDSVDEVVDASIELIREKFGDIDYITLTNPIDIHMPEILDSVSFSFGPTKLSTFSTMQLVDSIKTLLKSKGVISFDIGSFTIPDDYKYALVKFEGVNLNPEDIELFGDAVQFKIEGAIGGDTSHTPSLYDADGNLVTDRFYTENVLYDMGGTEHTITVTPFWVARKEGEVSASVTVEKLSDPLYPMMKNLSSVAPYLTAYHHGIVFGKPEFAFTADDDVFTEKAETCPGAYMPRINKELRGPSNEHIFNNIHSPLNDLLAKLADIEVENIKDLGYLREYYEDYPVYIALVGGATVLPQYIYDNVVWAAGTASDVIYGNIDPMPGWDNQQDDVFTYYPYQENIVGRITGWDVQDASTLITRTVFYDDIIDGLGDWKDRATVQSGCGVEFAKPLVLTKIAEMLGTTSHVSEIHAEPLKWPTGASKFVFDGIQKNSVESMGFDTTRSTYFESMRKGLSNEAINKLKKANLLNLLLLSKLQLKFFVGEDRVHGGEYQEESNFILAHGHGSAYMYRIGDIALAGLGLGYGPILPALLQIFVRVGEPYGPGASITIGEFDVRGVENMDFGPSFMFFESCLVGTIEGRYPETCISQAYLHAGMNALIASPTPTNCPGGYLEPYRPYSTMLGTIPGYIKAALNARKGIYPETHFGPKLFEDMMEEFKENDAKVGMALRNARNKYLPEDANWTMYWNPPLGLKNLGLFGKAEKTPALDAKYTCFQEYCLYGDPAFNPYEPINS